MIDVSGGQRECFTEACKTKWRRKGLCRFGGRYAVGDEFLEGAGPASSASDGAGARDLVLWAMG